MKIVVPFAICSAVILACAGPAEAAAYWFPYCAAKVQDTGFGSAATWGGVGNLNYLNFDQTADNVVWPEDTVFWNPASNAYGSFNTYQADRKVAFYIHNPTNSAYSGSSAILFKLNEASTGNSITASTTWKDDTGSSSSVALINTTSLPSGVSWDTTSNLFKIDLAAHASIELSTGQLFADTYAGPGYNFTFTAKLVVSTGSLQASCRGADNSEWRINANTTTSFGSITRLQAPYGYKGVDLPSGSVVLRLPFFREKFISSTGTSSTNIDNPDWTTQVFFANGDDSAHDYTIQVRGLDGTLINQKTISSLAPHARAGFTPSSYLDSATPGEGYVEIYGTRPVAIAQQIRFPKNAANYPSTGVEKYRLTIPHTADFFVEAYSGSPPN